MGHWRPCPAADQAALPPPLRPPWTLQLPPRERECARPALEPVDPSSSWRPSLSNRPSVRLDAHSSALLVKWVEEGDAPCPRWADLPWHRGLAGGPFAHRAWAHRAAGHGLGHRPRALSDSVMCAGLRAQVGHPRGYRRCWAGQWPPSVRWVALCHHGLGFTLCWPALTG